MTAVAKQLVSMGTKELVAQHEEVIKTHGIGSVTDAYKELERRATKGSRFAKKALKKITDAVPKKGGEETSASDDDVVEALKKITTA